MKVRRYKKENNKIITYYEDIEKNYEDNYSYGGWRSADLAAPKDTKHVYLEEFKAWGYSEELPKAYISCIYSTGMEDKVKEILNSPHL